MSSCRTWHGGSFSLKLSRRHFEISFSHDNLLMRVSFLKEYVCNFSSEQSATSKKVS